MAPILIAITGAPGAGKTPIVELLRQHFAGDVMTVPEVPSLFLENGMTAAGWNRVTGDRKADREFIHEIVAARERLEVSFSRVASLCGVRAIVCDRGLPDAAAYVGGAEGYAEIVSRNLADDVARYQLVIQLASVIGRVKSYPAKPSDPPADRIDSLEAAIRQVWCSNPSYAFLSRKTRLADQFDAVRGIVRDALDRVGSDESS